MYDPFGPCEDCGRFFGEHELEVCMSCCEAVCRYCWGDNPYLCKGCS